MVIFFSYAEMVHMALRLKLDQFSEAKLFLFNLCSVLLLAIFGAGLVALEAITVWHVVIYYARH
jgi:hypothetical protein